MMIATGCGYGVGMFHQGNLSINLDSVKISFYLDTVQFGVCVVLPDVGAR